ncbi:hypothetical protein [Soonwooa purpurea]
MPDKRLSNEDVQRNIEREKTIRQLEKLIENNFLFLISLPQVKQALTKGTDDYSIFTDKNVIRKLNKYLKANRKQFEVTLLNSIQNEWDYANEKLWKGLRSKYAKTLDQVSVFEKLKTIAEKTSRNSVNSARTFYNETKGGLTISNRVWLLYEQIPKEIDVMVQNAIKEGKSADDVTKDLKKNLKEPDRLYRKVKNKKTGKLEWSKAAQEYHPGQGVYRSSFKNANRLARTEINRAYRHSQWLSIQDNPLVSGYRIVLSNNTENQCSVCKRLAGDYPKWFLWTGWHPQCRCRMVPILITEAERKELYRLTFMGKQAEFKPKLIDNLPIQLNDYLIENKDRILRAATLPYWLQDNKSVMQNYF